MLTIRVTCRASPKVRGVQRLQDRPLRHVVFGRVSPQFSRSEDSASPPRLALSAPCPVRSSPIALRHLPDHVNGAAAL